MQRGRYRGGLAGLIGYLRADMDTDGNGFFSSWDDYRRELKTTEFKEEFDEVTNFLKIGGTAMQDSFTQLISSGILSVILCGYASPERTGCPRRVREG